MVKFVEMDGVVTLGEQMLKEVGPVVLLNTLKVEAKDVDALLTAWKADAAVMKRQPGFVSAQLHRGTAGSTVFMNYAVWQSVEHFRDAFANPEFQEQLGNYPESAEVSPHLFQRMAVDGICHA